METKLRDQLQKSIVVAQALLDAEEALKNTEPPPLSPSPTTEEVLAIERLALKTSARNKVLASAVGSDKAALFGTLSTEPTMDAKVLATALDVYPSLAESMVAEAVKMRAEALSLDLTPVDVEPLPGKDPMTIAPGDVGKVEELGL